MRRIAAAGGDAARAWWLSPIWVSLAWQADRDSSGWRKFRRRQLRRIAALRVKFVAAHAVFRRSLAVRFAWTVRVPRRPTEGMIANLLHVVEVLHRVRPDARVAVDWVLSGTETGFRYGKPGDDVWHALFQPVGPPVSRDAHRAPHGIDLALWGSGKDRLTGRALARHRHGYHATLAKWLRIDNDDLRRRIDDIRGRFPPGGLAIGVHRRVGNARVAELQHDGKVPSLADFVAATRAILTREARPDYAIFLATDDAEAGAAFQHAFGSRLIMQDAVQRTTANAEEVHFRDWGQLSISDAVDVLADAFVLAACDIIVHASSSVSTFAAIANPEARLVRVQAGRAAGR